MNPEPVIVTGVSAEPSIAEEGVIEAMAGTGFETGGGTVEAVPPPQPAMKETVDRSKVTRTNMWRFMVCPYAREK